MAWLLDGGRRREKLILGSFLGTCHTKCEFFLFSCAYFGWKSGQKWLNFAKKLTSKIFRAPVHSNKWWNLRPSKIFFNLWTLGFFLMNNKYLRLELLIPVFSILKLSHMKNSSSAITIIRVCMEIHTLRMADWPSVISILRTHCLYLFAGDLFSYKK